MVEWKKAIPFIVILLISALAPPIAYAATTPSFSDTLWQTPTMKADSYYLGATNVTDVLKYPEEAATYVIWKDGSTYYAKNGHSTVVVSNADAATIIQYALDNLTPTGEGGNGTVYLKNGRYLISSTIEMPSESSLIGEGIFSTILEPTGPSITVITNSEHVGGNYFLSIRDLTIGPATSGTPVGAYGISITNGKFVYINNVRIWYIDGTGIYLGDGYQYTIQNSIIHFCTDDGIYGKNDVQNGINIKSTVVELNGRNINIQGGTAHRIENCHLESSDTEQIVLLGAYSTIINNYMAITLSSYGIYCAGSYNKILDNTILTTYDAAIAVEGFHNGVISGNTIQSAGGEGITLAGDSSNTKITSNEIGATSNAIALYGTSNNCTIIGNNANLKNIRVETNNNIIIGNIRINIIIGSGINNKINLNTGYTANNNGFELTPTQLTDHYASGLYSNLTAGESVTIGQVLYLNADGKLYKSDASSSATVPAVAISCGSITINTSGYVLNCGYIRDDSWSWTVGGIIYASITAGEMTQTAPSGTGDQVQILGYALTSHIIYFDPNLMLIEMT